ncbi:ProQ/FINO family protein [Methylibium sp.]|uniref:ProQ/FINO family protein n=1 Tax=Methylibium sp. TaxID=2067992 RepID=UPI003D0D4FFD
MPDHPSPSSDSTAPAAPEDAAPAAAERSPAATAAQLAPLFPAAFGAGVFLPLKLGVQADIQQRAPGLFTKKALSGFLHRHTTSTAYLKALVGATHRVDLDGQPAGEVTDVHRQAATGELERRRSLHDARRAAERSAQRAAQDEARRARTADDEAQRGRAALLRAHETTTLTQANFCALKGLSAPELEARLAQAREERERRTSIPPPPPEARRGERRPGKPGR